MRITQLNSITLGGLVQVALLLAQIALVAPNTPFSLASATTRGVAQVEVDCTINLTLAGQMADIVSNALNRGLDQDPVQVRAFLKGANKNYRDGDAVLLSAAKHFDLEAAVLRREVERYRHCNCSHVGGEQSHLGNEGEALEISQFASDVTLHVVLHEIGHALVREFDLPVLGNEETLADAFATHYLTTHLPDRALDVLLARTRSLMLEAGEVERNQWTVSGEHNSDARRAFQIAALAVAADPAKFRLVALDVGMSEKEISSAADYGTEIHRSWRRLLAPLWMPDDMASNEARFVDETQLVSSELAATFRETLRRFDWHSQVKIRFVRGEGNAGWSRSKRTITVKSQYLERFVRQGRTVDARAKR